MNPVTRYQSTEIAISRDKNVFEQYSVAMSYNDIVGTRLKFSKGEYTAGREEEEIAEGTKFIANLHEWMIGWVKWEDGWEADDRGRPRDPWQLTNSLILQEPEGNRLFTFVTSSTGGIRAVGKLAGQYGNRLHHKPDEFPIIALEGWELPTSKPRVWQDLSAGFRDRWLGPKGRVREGLGRGPPRPGG